MPPLVPAEDELADAGHQLAHLHVHPRDVGEKDLCDVHVADRDEGEVLRELQVVEADVVHDVHGGARLGGDDRGDSRMRLEAGAQLADELVPAVGVVDRPEVAVVEGEPVLAAGLMRGGEDRLVDEGAALAGEESDVGVPPVKQVAEGEPHGVGIVEVDVVAVFPLGGDVVDEDRLHRRRGAAVVPDLDRVVHDGGVEVVEADILEEILPRQALLGDDRDDPHPLVEQLGGQAVGEVGGVAAPDAA